MWDISDVQCVCSHLLEKLLEISLPCQHQNKTSCRKKAGWASVLLASRPELNTKRKPTKYFLR